ncbi:MAG TPA: peptidase MA family metallohydrolase [Anaerolineae bacterium]
MKQRALVLVASLVVLVTIISLAFAAPIRADSAITVTSNKFTNQFPTQLLFDLGAQSSAKITQVALVVQIGQCVSNRYLPDFTPGNQVQASYAWDMRKNYMPPGTSGQFWWSIQDDAGNQLQSAKLPFRVDDPAHVWQKLANDQLALYWYTGGADFGQALYARGGKAIEFLQQQFAVKLDQQVQIFIYGNHTDLLKSLAVGAQEWTGGQDFPEYSIVMIGVAPTELDWGLGATAHELTHQVVHRTIQNGCSSLGSASLPPLMDEGLAVYNENPGSADPQFTLAVKRAVQNDTLIPIRSLTSAFPADSAMANLSYGESWSFVDFLIRVHGKDKMGQFLNATKQGGTIDDLMHGVYGLDLDGLEGEWRKDIGAQPHAIPTRNSAAPTPFPTFGLSTGDTPVAASPRATATTQAVAVNATPVPAPTSVPSSPANPVTNLCGGGFSFIALGIVGVALWKRKRNLQV